MTELIALRSPKNKFVCYVFLDEYEQLDNIPYFTEAQARVATKQSEDSWRQITRSRRYIVNIPGAPDGYLFFGLVDGEDRIYSIVVSGPYGILPGVYSSPELATEAATSDWRDHNKEDPIVTLGYGR